MAAILLLPGLAHSSLAVQSLRRRPLLVHHLIRTTAYVTTIINNVMGCASAHQGLPAQDRNAADWGAIVVYTER